MQKDYNRKASFEALFNSIHSEESQKAGSKIVGRMLGLVGSVLVFVGGGVSQTHAEVVQCFMLGHENSSQPRSAQKNEKAPVAGSSWSPSLSRDLEEAKAVANRVLQVGNRTAFPTEIRLFVGLLAKIDLLTRGKPNFPNHLFFSKHRSLFSFISSFGEINAEVENQALQLVEGLSTMANLKARKSQTDNTRNGDLEDGLVSDWAGAYNQIESSYSYFLNLIREHGLAGRIYLRGESKDQGRSTLGLTLGETVLALSNPLVDYVDKFWFTSAIAEVRPIPGAKSPTEDSAEDSVLGSVPDSLPQGFLANLDKQVVSLANGVSAIFSGSTEAGENIYSLPDSNVSSKVKKALSTFSLAKEKTYPVPKGIQRNELRNRLNSYNLQLMTLDYTHFVLAKMQMARALGVAFDEVGFNFKDNKDYSLNVEGVKDELESAIAANNPVLFRHMVLVLCLFFRDYQNFKNGWAGRIFHLNTSRPLVENYKAQILPVIRDGIYTFRVSDDFSQLVLEEWGNHAKAAKKVIQLLKNQKTEETHP